MKKLHSTIYKFVCDTISEDQYGFLKQQGPKDALSLINSLLCDKIKQKQPVVATFLDLSKIFDTVNHQILQEKINNYGISGNTPERIKNYLFERNNL